MRGPASNPILELLAFLAVVLPFVLLGLCGYLTYKYETWKERKQHAKKYEVKP